MNRQIERFWKKVVKAGPDECWVWSAAKNGKGYGKVRVNGRLEYAHRVSFSLGGGPIPEGMTVDHVCHNTSCVNPAHLRVCTISQNVTNSRLRSDNTSGFKSVYPSPVKGKWVAQINRGGKRCHIGTYNSPEEAHAAYVRESKALWGEFACSGLPHKVSGEEAA